MDNLEQEIDRQIVICEGLQNGTESSADLQRVEGLVTLEKQPAAFHEALKALRRRIHNTSILWKVPAFSKPTPYLIDPEGQISRSKAIQSHRAVRDPAKSAVDDVWTHKSLESWISSEHSQLLLVQGQYQTIHRLHRFGFEMAVFLHADTPTLIMLQSFMKPAEDRGVTSLRPEQVLRQLALQALQKVSTPTPISFLANVVERFHRATSLDNWLEVLRFILSQLAQIHIVLDLGILNHDPEAVDRLSTALDDLASDFQLRSTSTVLKIMLLTSRRTDKLEGSLGSSIFVGPIKRLPRSASLAVLKERLASQVRNNKPTQSSIDTSEEICGKKEPMAEGNRRSDGSNFTARISILGKQLETNDVQLLDHPENKVADFHENAHTSRDLTSNRTFLGDTGRYRLAESVPSEASTTTGKRAASRSETVSTAGGHSRYSITVAIVCALPLEADAVCALFDDHWDDDLLADLVGFFGDTNSYSMGRIGRHHVVLIHMAGIGKNYAATAAAYCKASFPDVVLALLVGVCGGVPDATEKGVPSLVLGDVVISEGVVAFDFGRQYPDMFLRKTGMMDTLGRPPPVVRAKLAKLRTRHDRKLLNEKMSQYLNILADEFGDEISYPGTYEDKLFESTYHHKHRRSAGCSVCNDDSDKNSVCEKARTASCKELDCDDARLVPRERLRPTTVPPREPTVRPIVHFGLVASGDQVLKSGEHRDRIAAREGVVAFEMEAAATWEHFPCVVIKGVCDYADSHKQKEWQNYAAATAAACMKAFLDKWHFRA
ncbi:NB-ARC and TPR domain-containing protein [Colletotrichum tofieldiae]|nr:NB-ARC and TPR domain-containing protein [Colletotrichum tofieldiae]